MGERQLLVSVKQAASLLGISRGHVYRLIRDGQLHPIHLGRCARLRVEELGEFIATLAAGGAQA